MKIILSGIVGIELREEKKGGKEGKKKKRKGVVTFCRFYKWVFCLTKTYVHILQF